MNPSSRRVCAGIAFCERSTSATSSISSKWLLSVNDAIFANAQCILIQTFNLDEENTFLRIRPKVGDWSTTANNLKRSPPGAQLGELRERVTHLFETLVDLRKKDPRKLPPITRMRSVSVLVGRDCFP